MKRDMKGKALLILPLYHVHHVYPVLYGLKVQNFVAATPSRKIRWASTKALV
jgi:hypothetical protein